MTKKRTDLSGDGEPLTNNPFGALRGMSPSPSPEGAPPPPLPQEIAGKQQKSAISFQIAKTRKGGLPIFIEKRPGGKVVTVIRNVSGDRDGLLKLLKKTCGAGGVVRDDAIELQGDHHVRVETLIKEHC